MNDLPANAADLPQPLIAARFPLWGSRLIEASAGTGKTWTIAALYVRLVLAHGGAAAFNRPLLPAEILVMTFTRAATRELSDRIRARLVEAMRCFRGEQEPAAHDTFLHDVLADYPGPEERKRAALLLATAAQGMDEAAVFTIDAWCQRMLREHAFDSGSLFDEKLSEDEGELLLDATRDYWRTHVYPLPDPALDAVISVAASPAALAQQLKGIFNLTVRPPGAEDALADFAQSAAAAAQLSLVARQRWYENLSVLEAAWNNAYTGGWLNGNSYNRVPNLFPERLASIAVWAQHGVFNHHNLRTWLRNLTPASRNFKKGVTDAQTATLDHPAADAIALWLEAETGLLGQHGALLVHAANWVEQRMQLLKKQRATFGFKDMLLRLDAALAGPNGATLRERIAQQYPVALIDEFQDTSPLQYGIFNALYQTARNDAATGLFLIGDPKQSIYRFRGADIHSYLAARAATAGRHYALQTNYRSSHGLVQAANRLFEFAETSFARGAFRFRRGHDGANPLPFRGVDAQGRSETLMSSHGRIAPFTFCHSAELLNKVAMRRHFAAACAARMVALLNDPDAGFAHADGSFSRLQPADLAVLVRDGKEAQAIRRELQQRGVVSVYLSDKNSVLKTQEAQDLLRWLSAVASPLDAHAARAAWACTTVGLGLGELALLAQDDHAWDERVALLKTLHKAWQSQGVLAMLRLWLHELDLPARLLALPAGGERALTNLLHLAELLQNESQRLDGEQALIRWLAEQLASDEDNGDERIVRLESDAELVQVVTVHKSKGLEYPLVFLPFASSFRAEDARNRSVVEFLDEDGQLQVDFTLSRESLERADEARLQEDLRLLYVAATRARHAMWLGVAAPKVGNSARSHLDKSALGYLLAGGEQITEAEVASRLQALAQHTDSIHLEPLSAPDNTLFQPRNAPTALPVAPHYHGQIDHDWSIASFSALIRDLRSELTPGQTPAIRLEAATSAREETLQEAPDEAEARHTDAAPWHRFPRGPLPGTLLHDQLEWLARQGFDFAATPEFVAAMALRCKRVGWSNRVDEVTHWLTEIAATPLQPLGVPLASLSQAQTLPEMEFWFPSAELHSTHIDALCSQHLLAGQPRPVLAARTLRGMIKGYIDLVFEYEGRYWLVDYKSNALGLRDADYQAGTLQAAMAQHRYDVQGALYMLALHRLLQQRLGAAYQPEQHLGGAIYLFLRGIKGPEQGCYVLPAHPQLLQALDHSLKDHEPA